MNPRKVRLGFSNPEKTNPLHQAEVRVHKHTASRDMAGTTDRRVLTTSKTVNGKTYLLHATKGWRAA